MSALRSSTPTPKKRILIVDDEIDTRQHLAPLLEQEGFEVSSADHALDAVMAIHRRRPDLILAGTQMPIRSGLSLLHELKHYEDTSVIPVIVLDSRDSVEIREAAIKAGCATYITKPINSDTLLAHIREIFRSEPGPEMTSK